MRLGKNHGKLREFLLQSPLQNGTYGVFCVEMPGVNQGDALLLGKPKIVIFYIGGLNVMAYDTLHY